MENEPRISAVPPGRILFWTLNPAQCAGLISGCPCRDEQRRLVAPESDEALQPPTAPLLSTASEFQKDSMPTLNWIGKEAVVTGD
jgi:hypothetical protein